MRRKICASCGYFVKHDWEGKMDGKCERWDKEVNFDEDHCNEFVYTTKFITKEKVIKKGV